mgnify:CR=1 FL=1
MLGTGSLILHVLGAGCWVLDAERFIQQVLGVGHKSIDSAGAVSWVLSWVLAERMCGVCYVCW